MPSPDDRDHWPTPEAYAAHLRARLEAVAEERLKGPHPKALALDAEAARLMELIRRAQAAARDPRPDDRAYWPTPDAYADYLQARMRELLDERSRTTDKTDRDAITNERSRLRSRLLYVADEIGRELSSRESNPDVYVTPSRDGFARFRARQREIAMADEPFWPRPTKKAEE